MGCCHGITQGHLCIFDDLVSPAEWWASSWAGGSQNVDGLGAGLQTTVQNICQYPTLILGLIFLPQALPPTQMPEVFGMHDNVDISKQLQETKLLFESVLLTQGSGGGAGGGKTDDKVHNIAGGILAKVRAVCDVIIFRFFKDFIIKNYYNIYLL